MDAQLARATANALWKNLRRNRWQHHTVTRDLNKTNPRGYQARPPTSIPKPPSASATVILHHEEWITALLLREEWNGNASYAIRLDRQAHDLALSLLTAETLAHYRDLTTASCRQPFTRQLNRHGIPKLRRNPHEPRVTPLAALALQKIAATSTLRQIDELDINEYLIGDCDLPPDLIAALAHPPARALDVTNHPC